VIAQAETISETEFKKLQDKKAKTKTERYQERKALLKEGYGVEATPELVEKDDAGWYPQLRQLTYVGRMGSRDKRERVYQFVEAKDGRDMVYQQW
jgi:hypothetical protein